jgi:hypothetical protein
MKRLLRAALALAAFLPLVCDQQSQSDTVPPTVSWLYPRDGDTIDPGAYTLAARASDDREMGFVVFYAGAEMLGMVTRPGPTPIGST